MTITDVKDRIHQMVDSIQDQEALVQVMEDVSFYSSKKDAVDYLNENQLKELDAAIKEADNGEMISWNDFKNEIDGWKKKS